MCKKKIVKKKTVLTMTLFNIICQVLEKMGYNKDHENKTMYEWVCDRVTLVDVPEDFIDQLG